MRVAKLPVDSLNSKCSSTAVNALMQDDIGSLYPNTVRWKHGCSNVEFRRDLLGTRKFNIESNSGASTSPFKSLATSNDCCTFRRCSNVSKPSNWHLSAYGGRLSVFRHGKLLRAKRINRLCTLSIRRLHVTWYGCHTTDTFSKIGRTSEQYSDFQQ